MFKTLRVGQDVTPKRELDRKSADKLHPFYTLYLRSTVLRKITTLQSTIN